MRWLAVVAFLFVAACGAGYQPAPDPGPPFRRMELIGVVASHSDPPGYVEPNQRAAESRIGPTTLTMVGGRTIEVPAGTLMFGNWCWGLAKVKPPVICAPPCWFLAELDEDRRTAKSLYRLLTDCMPIDRHQGPPDGSLRASDSFQRVADGYLVDSDDWGYPLPDDDVPVKCIGAKKLAEIRPGSFIDVTIDHRTGLVAKVTCIYRR